MKEKKFPINELDPKVKEKVTEFLKKHQFDYRWNKKDLAIKKLGVGWRIDINELIDAYDPCMAIEYTVKCYPGYGYKWYENDELYSYVYMEGL